MNINLVRVSLLSAVCFAAVSTSANAAGFYIQEQSVRGLGSAFSGSTTTLDDASTIWFNPAGMTRLNGIQAQAGVNVIMPHSKIKDNGTTSGPSGGRPVGVGSGNPYSPTPVPNGFLSYQISDQFWAGVGITAPFGLGSDYDTGWFGRFDSTKTKLKTIDIQPTIAYKINDWLSIGGGINIAHAEADLRNAVILGAGVEGNSKLSGKDWGYGYSLGAEFKPTDMTTLGVSYKSEVHQNLDGNILVTNGSAIVAAATSNGSAKLTTPDQLSFGVAQKLNDRLTVQGQATWFGWNNFDAITAFRDSGAIATSVVQDYQNTWAFALGAEYQATDDWRFRAGVQYDNTPTTDAFRTTRTPDGDRTWLSAGATYAITPNLDLDLAATYIHVASENINVLRGTGAGRTIANTEGSVGIVATGLSFKF
jgi:long-chain fatty acid transport protein